MNDTLIEFLGNLNTYESNCEANTYPVPYSRSSPSRQVDCTLAAMRSRDASAVKVRALVDYPAVDEEYWEWLDILDAVETAKPHRPFGETRHARNSTMRALSCALRSFQP